MLAYYARAATQAFWAEHWGGYSPEALARVAETSPLTELIMRSLPLADRPVLEAGCGLGQYVALLRTRGYPVIGADWALEPLRLGRAWAKDAPLAAMDLAQLAFADGAFAAYMSLGVVEHDPSGPDRILVEAARVLAPGGTLLLSVPYVNLARRLGARSIRRANARVRAAGGTFYQFAFCRREVLAMMERNGFRVVTATPYDPGRLLHRVWRRLRAAFQWTAATTTSSSSGGVAEPLPSRRHPLFAAVRWLLYTPPALRALGHMILVVAVKR